MRQYIFSNYIVLTEIDHPKYLFEILFISMKIWWRKILNTSIKKIHAKIACFNIMQSLSLYGDDIGGRYAL